MLPYQQLLTILPKLRFKDDSALRSIGLAQLAKRFDAYPVDLSGRRGYCLLVKGAEIPTAAKLTQGTAAKQIIVLQEETRGFAKVWPNADSAAASAPAPVPVQAAPAAEAKKSDEPIGSLEFVDE